MKLMRSSSLAAAAFALVVGFAAEAAAQQPVLNVTANGNSVTIEWSEVAGALGYNLQAGTASGQANVASVNIPAAIPRRIVVAAPSGRYFLRVRAYGAGGIQGPFSNEVEVNVGSAAPPAGPCSQPERPTVTTNVSGGTVTVKWNNTGTGYRVQYSRVSGATELTVDTNSTEHTQYVGMVGTFYVRVVAANSCGTTTSNEVSFRIENLNSGGGPRTPNPAPGTLIPRASLGYAMGVIQSVANQYRGDLLNSCAEHGGNNVFMFRVVQALRRIDTRWGMNDKRGWPNSLSQDILAYNPTDRPDNGEAQIYLYDVIAGHCTGNPDVWMQDVTDITWAGGNSGICGNQFCARWTIDAYLRGGFPADPRE